MINSLECTDAFFFFLAVKCIIYGVNSERTWLQIRFHTEDQLPGLHVEEADLAVCEGCDQMSWFTAHQVHRGGNSQL